MTIILYIITILLDRIGLLDFISLPISLIFVKITKSHIISAAIGFFITFFLLDLIWVKFEGGNLPLVLISLIFVSDFLMQKKGMLTKYGQQQNRGEQIALIMITLKLLLFSSQIRWY